MKNLIIKLQGRLVKLKTFVPEFCDVCLFVGLAVLWYGLYGYLPWLSHVVGGAILMAIGLLDGRGRNT